MDRPASSPSAPRSINGQQQRSNPIHTPMARPAHSIPGTRPGERDWGRKEGWGGPPFLGGQGERNGGPPPIRSRCAEEDSGFFF
ncbi:hypothetical protein GQ55_2G268900 [Panicum hallii var. hallii]|uniref:Uncharacterized protein n=1 Tax=Panicum hallii var. hallii TaxID=1504633 RepID=A0A2T7ESP8_9POAL|nr:hypothetical protein GQ55_2G268900 [Panicum hallii var. hallii]